MKFAPLLILAALSAPCAVAPASAKRPEELRQDKLEIQRLNREAAARFAARDARYREEAEQSQARIAAHARAQAQYERDMAQWRRRVAACNAGDWSACDNR